jgi:hypothetical protein
MFPRAMTTLTLLLGGCNVLPWLEQSVRLPDRSTTVRVMIRSGGEYRTVVENELGSASITDLPIAGGHRRTSLYLAPHHQLVTIEAGGDSNRFDITPGMLPRAVEADSRIAIGPELAGLAEKEDMSFNR